jgi:sigma-54 dependent transcriptional regulator, acetoin dehydrogenase operon transcriptional activator AcoR
MRLTNHSADRQFAIAARRQAVLIDGAAPAANDWLEQSWLRCLALGQRPEQAAVFQAISRSKIGASIDEHHALITAATPVMEQLAKSIANTQYFVILTDNQGLVLNAHGAYDKSDKRAAQITSIGIDLSEQAVGTTSIGATLAEQKPVWLHQGEHFLSSNRIYSCAGAPIFGAQNECIGMLDLTGIEVPERRELVHLAARSAKEIQNALIHSKVSSGKKGQRILQLQWLGAAFDSGSTGMIIVDEDGFTTGFNRAALDWLPDLAVQKNQHCEALFSLSTHEFFACLYSGKMATLPLWSGIQVAAKWQSKAASNHPTGDDSSNEVDGKLRSVEAELVHRAITSAKGNVALAAQKLGISRATLYRKLHKVVKR